MPAAYTYIFIEMPQGEMYIQAKKGSKQLLLALYRPGKKDQYAHSGPLEASTGYILTKDGVYNTTTLLSIREIHTWLNPLYPDIIQRYDAAASIGPLPYDNNKDILINPPLE